MKLIDRYESTNDEPKPLATELVEDLQEMDHAATESAEERQQEVETEDCEQGDQQTQR